MSLSKDIADIYTKSSVYYLQLQYLVVCYLIVLVAAFFVLPMPREFGIDGVARLAVGCALYIGFAVLMVFAPKLLESTVGQLFSYEGEIEEIKQELEQSTEIDKVELEQELWSDSSITMKIVAEKDFVMMGKKHKIATNIFFQCILMELFCLMVLINSDHSLLISNPVTQHIADVLSAYTDSDPSGRRYYDSFFVVDGEVVGKRDTYGKQGSLPFSQVSYMAESIFFVYVIFLFSYFVRLCSMFVALRPILIREDIFPMVKNANTSGKKVFAILGTLAMAIVTVCLFYVLPKGLSIFISQIETTNHYAWFSFLLSVGMANVLFFFRFMEDWYKRIFHKF